MREDYRLHPIGKENQDRGTAVTKGQIELNVDIRLKKDDTDFINELSDLKGVESAVLVSYNGDYMS